MKNTPGGLKSLKRKIDKLDIEKLEVIPTDLSKLKDVVKYDVFKQDVYNAKITNISY